MLIRKTNIRIWNYSIVRAVQILTSIDISHSVNGAYSPAGLRSIKIISSVLKKKKKTDSKYQQKSWDTIALFLASKAPSHPASPNYLPILQDPRHLYACASAGIPTRVLSSLSLIHPNLVSPSESSPSLIFSRKSFLALPDPSHLPIM